MPTPRTPRRTTRSPAGAGKGLRSEGPARAKPRTGKPRTRPGQAVEHRKPRVTGSRPEPFERKKPRVAGARPGSSFERSKVRPTSARAERPVEREKPRAAPKAVETGPLTASQKRYLRGLAHDLKAVILVGQKGVTPALLAEFDGALAFHELIKVKLADDDRESRAESIEQIHASSGAEIVQTIGKIAVFYRRNPDRAQFTLPR
jgi:RNA-binding protein